MIAAIPYIALQLKAISISLTTVVDLTDVNGAAFVLPFFGDIALLVALVLALFAILFGTRHIDATEHHHGLMLAIATESIIKLIAFLAVGIFVVFNLFDGPADLYRAATQNPDVVAVFSKPPAAARGSR